MLLFPIILLISYCRIFCNASITTCPDGTVNDRCGLCTSTNDPHIHTFDDAYYDNHVPLCYKYVTNCPNNDVYLPFEICGCHYYCTNTVACIGDITITFKDESGATYQIDIDHTLGTATNTLAPPSLNNGNTYTFDTTNNHKFAYGLTGTQHTFNIYSGAGPLFYAYILYQSGYLQVFLSEMYFKNNVCGLCGFFDGNRNNDFLGSDNVQYLTAAIINNPPFSVNGRIPQIPANVAIINQFSNTYICGDQTLAPTRDPSPSPTRSPLQEGQTATPTSDPCPDCNVLCHNQPCTGTDHKCPDCLGYCGNALCPGTPCGTVDLCETQCPDTRNCIRDHREITVIDRDITVIDRDIPVRRRNLETECRDAAGTCCGVLWDDIISKYGWDNPILDQSSEKSKSIEGCIRDVCLITDNNYTLPCDTSDFVFKWAKEIATLTVQETYPILRIVATPDTTSAKSVTTSAKPVTTSAKPVGLMDTTSKSYSDSDSSDLNSDSDESILYSAKAGNNNDENDTDKAYTINVLLSNTSSNMLWLIIVVIILVFNGLLYWFWVSKRNNKTKTRVESDESDINESKI